MANQGDDDVFNGTNENQRKNSATRGFPPAAKMPAKKNRPLPLAISTTDNVYAGLSAMSLKFAGTSPIPSSAGLQKDIDFWFGMDKPKEEKPTNPGLLERPWQMHVCSLLTPTFKPAGAFNFPSSEEALIKEIEDTFQKLQSTTISPDPDQHFEPVIYNVELTNALFVVLAQPGSRLDVIELVKVLTDLLGQLARLPTAEFLKKMPDVGDVVLAPFNDENGYEEWFRGAVVRASKHGDQCEVLFPDFGNAISLLYSQLVVCPERVAQQEPFTVLCKLTGLDFGFVPQDPENILGAFREIVSKEQAKDGLTGRIRNSTESSCEIELSRFYKDAIQQDVWNLGTTFPPGKAANRHGRNIIPLGLRKVQVKALVNHSSLDFYCWPDVIHEESVAKIKASLHRISETLKKRFNQPHVVIAMPEEGFYVAVFLEPYYYRAVVMKVLFPFKTATVRLLDYGIEVTIPFDDIRLLIPDDLEDVPVAVKFSVVWADEKWARIPKTVVVPTLHFLGSGKRSEPMDGFNGDVANEPDSRLEAVNNFVFEVGRQYEINVAKVYMLGELDHLGREAKEQTVEALMRIPEEWKIKAEQWENGTRNTKEVDHGKAHHEWEMKIEHGEDGKLETSSV